MENYSIYIEHEKQKYSFIEIVHRAGAELTAVAGCGTGYHISISATPTQAAAINAEWSAA